MEAARLFDHFWSRLEEKVVGVAEHELQANCLDIEGVERLEGAIGSDRHKARGVDDAVRRVDATHACGGVLALVEDLKLEGHLSAG